MFNIISLLGLNVVFAVPALDGRCLIMIWFAFLQLPLAVAEAGCLCCSWLSILTSSLFPTIIIYFFMLLRPFGGRCDQFSELLVSL